MAFIVEDGTGIVNANSYISVSDADDYFDARNTSAWDTLSDDVKEGLLIQATDYIELTYYDRWIGVKTNTGQALSWPRMNFEQSSTVSLAGYGGWYFAGDPLIGNGSGWPLSGLYRPNRETLVSNQVPGGIKFAACDLALIANSQPLLVNHSQQKKSIKVGPITVEYDTDAPQAKDFVQSNLRLTPFIKTASRSMGRLVRC